jgi:hypothetical protein
MKWAVMFILFFGGIGLFEQDALGPVHEYFHVKAAEVEGATLLKLTRTQATFNLTNAAIIKAGYFGETMLWATLALMFGKYGTIFAGLFYAAAEEAPRSVDFIVHMAAKVSESEVSQNIASFRTMAVILGMLLVARYVAMVVLAVKKAESTQVAETEGVTAPL